MADTHRTVRLLGQRSAIAPVGAMVGLTLIDAVLAARLFGVLAPALLADVACLVALVLALARDGSDRFVALVVAASASVAISAWVFTNQISDSTDWSANFTPVMGHGAWPGMAELAALGFLTAWCVRSSRAAVAGAAAVLLALAMLGLYHWRQDGDYGWVLGPLYGGGWIVVLVAGIYLRLLDQGQAEHARQVRHEERIAIARELHDMVAHHVTGIVVQAQAARLVADRRPDVASDALAAIEHAGGQALGAMRRLVGTLRDESAEAEMTPTATIADLRAIADQQPSGNGEPAVHLRLDRSSEALPGEVMASVHRIAQEAVTNARRHAAGASAIDVDVSCISGRVTVEVTDDGTSGGATRAGPGGFGLTGMAERAEALGGCFTAGPLPSGGWRVRADLPVEGART